MTAIKHALIVGGGIAGPIAALALQKAGIESTVYEEYATSAEGVGGTMMLAPNGLEALRVVDVDEDIASIGQPIRRMLISNGRGRKLAEFDGLPGMPSSRVLWRSDLYGVLRRRAESAGIRIECGRKLIDAADTPDGVIARFADGSMALGDILIGADGIHSTVRKLIDPLAPAPQYTGILGFGGYANDAKLRGSTDEMHFVFGGHAFIGHWTDASGRVLWFGSLPYAQALTAKQARETPSSEWLRILRELYADDVPAQDLLRSTSADQLFVAGAGEMLPSIPHWHRGRMVLVGDAVHAPSSSSGQGASLAAESAIELVRCLRDVPDASRAFAAYEAMRRARVEKVAADAARTNANKASGPLARALMNLLMPIAMKTVFNPAKTFGALHRYRIRWDERVAA